MVSLYCLHCGVTCVSPVTLSYHVNGHKHRDVISRVAPEELKEFGRLQYFLDVYLKNHLILGLEYVEESQEWSSYRYKCLVCDVEDGWRGMVRHITNMEHSERYIFTHHSHLIDTSTRMNKDNRIRKMKVITKMLKKKGGICRQIRCKKPDECGTENGTLPEEVRPPEDPVKQNKGVDNVTRSKRLERGIGNYSVEQQTCMLCSVRCPSPMVLCSHYMGKIHRRKMELAMPGELKELGRLSHFIHNHMKDLPVLGLEYIVEEKVESSYQYSCQLCNVKISMQKMVGHVLNIKHIELYIKTHHANLLPRMPKSENNLYIKDLRVCVKWIIEKHGQKEIQVKDVSLSNMTEDESLPKGEGCSRKMLDGEDNESSSSKYDSGNSSHAKRRPFPYEKTGLEEICSSENMSDMSTADGPPLAKRGRVSPEVHQDSLSSSCPVSMYSGSSYNESLQQDTPPCVMDANSTTAVQEFQTNQEFFEYLANFRIKDDEDALLIQTITQNCIRALTNFQKEEMERQTAFRQPEASFAHTHSTDEGSPDIEKAAYQPETPMVHTSKTNSQAPDIPVNRAVSHLLDSNTYLPTKASNPSSNVSSKNEITNFFFNSIKEMDESEVVGIFQKIATTNPEFHGINVPSVMRILKNSGRLKNP